ncbi:MAG: GAP family protein [Methylococcales bacterium]|nr:GAP family protein [Methylococcales bacterium]
MLELLARIIPLSIASAMSPVILGLAISLLAGKNHPEARAISFLLGGAVVALILAGIAFAVVAGAASGNVPHIPAYVDVVLGALFVAFAAKEALEKEGKRPGLKKAGKGPALLKWFAISFVANMTNFDAVLLNITAVKEILQAGVGTFHEALLVLVADLFFILPVLLPLAIYAVASERTEKTLAPVGAWMQKYGRYIVAAIFLVFGIYLLWKGFSAVA